MRPGPAPWSATPWSAAPWSAKRRASLGLALLALLCVGASAWLVTDTVRARASAGVWHASSYDARCADDPSWADTARRELVPEPFHGEVLPDGGDARCDLYRGYLVVRARARLSIELHASGDTSVMLGKRELVRLEAGAVRVTRRAERTLEAGSHFLELRSVQRGHLAYLRLSARLDAEATDEPLATRALFPLDHDALAPSLVDGERLRGDGSFARRTGARLAGVLALVTLTLVLAGGARVLARGSRGARPWARALEPVVALVLLSVALLALAGLGDADPHFVAHGARAWRTLWLSVPRGAFADAIPALGPAEWLLGASWSLGGAHGPAVLAVVLGALEVLWLSRAAAHVAGRAAGLGAAALGCAAAIANGPLVIDRSTVISLGLALLALLTARALRGGPLSRAVGRLARRASASSASPESPLVHARSNARRASASLLVVLALVDVGAIAVGSAPRAIAGSLALVLALALHLGRGALLATPRAPAAPAG
jgi:hypothetical protein